MTRHSLTFVLVGFLNASFAQVSNNSIGNRSTLILDKEAIHSTTAESSVEWNCVNKVLTDKCLVYHNDQWFEFSVPAAGTYFLNLSGQQCREKRGLQAIVIEGNPCKVKTYRILHCISQVPQDDVFLRLDSLKSGISYLLNIDGFLKDFCDFKIKLATYPEGVPLDKKNTATERSRAYPQTGKIAIDWKVTAEKIADFDRFKVYRRYGQQEKTVLVNEQPVKRNAYGTQELNYQASDSLDREGNFTYQVYGIHQVSLVPVLLVVREVKYVRPAINPSQQRILRLPLGYPDQTPLKILIYDRDDVKLSSEKYIFDAGRGCEVDLGPFLDKGMREFMILVSDGKAQRAQEFFYRVDARGQLVRE